MGWEGRREERGRVEGEGHSDSKVDIRQRRNVRNGGVDTSNRLSFVGEDHVQEKGRKRVWCTRRKELKDGETTSTPTPTSSHRRYGHHPSNCLEDTYSHYS